LTSIGDVGAENGKIKIVPEILLGSSREKEIDLLKSFNNNQHKLYIKSKTIDEATAFPLAFLNIMKMALKKEIVVIDNRETFSKFIQMTLHPLF
jgi:hypothetical protein